MIKYKYMLVRTNMIWRNTKYQIGRTYVKNKNSESFDLNYINSAYAINCDQYKILKIKDYGYCFKILCEINYSDIKIEIAAIGRPQDLNILVYDENSNVVQNVLLNGRTKDINKHIKDSSLTVSIIQTGIDKYLDKFVNSENINIKYFIAEQGRKCDLDILVHNKEKLVKKAVANHGFDEHLDILVKEKNPIINQIINRLRGKRE